MRHFIDLKDFDSDRLQAMLETAAQMKSGTDKNQPLAGKYVGMIFEKPSPVRGFPLKWGYLSLAARLLFWRLAICSWGAAKVWPIPLVSSRAIWMR